MIILKRTCLLPILGLVFCNLISPLALNGIPADDPTDQSGGSPIDWLRPEERQQRLPNHHTVIAQADDVSPGTATPSQKAGAEEETFLISFSNLSIIEVLKFISKISGKNFIFDEEDMQFSVTIVSQEPTSVNNIMSALLQVLRVRGLTMIEQGNNIVIHSNKAVLRLPRLTGDGFDEPPSDESELETRVIRLTNLSPDKISALIKPILSKDAQVQFLAETNHVIITDLSANVERVARLIEEVDTPSVALEVGQYLVRNRDIESLVKLVDDLMRPVVGDSTYRLSPNDASNSIFVVSTPFLVERTIGMLQTLDLTGRQTRILNMDSLKYLPVDSEGRIVQPTLGEDGRPLGGETEEERLARLRRDSRFDELQPEEKIRLDSRLFDERLARGEVPVDSPELKDQPKRFRIHRLKNRKSAALVESLSLVADSLEEAGSQQAELLEVLRSVQAVDETNTLVFTGVDSAVEELEDLIERLDVPLRQVFIELLIFETDVLNSQALGVDWNLTAQFTPDQAIGGSNTNITQSPVNGAMDSIGSSPDIGSLVGFSQGLSVGALGRVIRYQGKRFLDLGALLVALEVERNSTVLLNPKLLVEDGGEAEFFVGENKPFQTTSTTVAGSDNVETTFEYRDIGSRITVRPFIGEGDWIRLEIDQEKSGDVGEQETQTEQQQSLQSTTSKVTTSTVVHVPNGAFVVLSGQIRDQHSLEKRGIPCLGNLPLLGPLFSLRQTTFPERVNLMIFVRPIIVDTPEEMRKLTTEQNHLYQKKSRRAIPKKGQEYYKYDLRNGVDWLNPGDECCGEE